MVFIFGLAIIFATFAFVAYPLLSPSRKEAVIGDELESELQVRKDSTYSALKELEFDYDLGNLSPADHRDLEERYKDKAINILKEMDTLEEKAIVKKAFIAVPVDDLEREILQARKGKAIDVEEESGAALSITCPKCNSPVKRGDKFCSECGAKLI